MVLVNHLTAPVSSCIVIAVSNEDGRRDVLELYLQVARSIGANMYDVALRHDLTPIQAMTLKHVGDGPLPTKDIAQHLCCDPSNATGIVDQLERRGLVRRTTPPEDRRKRLVEPTDAGLAVVRALRQAMAGTASRFDRLCPADRAALHRILELLASP